MADDKKSSFADTPEFRAAVKKEAETAVRGLFDELRAAKGAAPEGSSPDRTLISSLALELAELTGQGSGRRYVAPEILRSRAQAADRMMELIHKAAKDRTLPTYRVTGKVLLEDQIVEPFYIGKDHVACPTEIGWGGVPNEAMSPINEVAQEIFAAFQASIGSTEKVTPQDRYGITPKGLVVKNAAIPQKREVGQAQFAEHPSNNGDAPNPRLTVPHRAQAGQQTNLHVLGTLQPPAQSYTPGQTSR